MSSQQGNGPPPESSIAAPDLWALITQMPRAFRRVPFPRKRADGSPIGEIAMVVLDQTESQAVTANTEQFVRKVLKEHAALAQNGEPSAGYSMLFETRASQEILFRAARRADDIGRGFFPTVEAIGKLTTDEIGVLMFEYRRVQSEIGPIVSQMSQEEYDAWIERLATGGSAFPLDSLSLGAMSGLVMYMAKRLWTSKTDISSPGLPLDDPT